MPLMSSVIFWTLVVFSHTNDAGLQSKHFKCSAKHTCTILTICGKWIALVESQHTGNMLICIPNPLLGLIWNWQPTLTGHSHESHCWQLTLPTQMTILPALNQSQTKNLCRLLRNLSARKQRHLGLSILISLRMDHCLGYLMAICMPGMNSIK